VSERGARALTVLAILSIVGVAGAPPVGAAPPAASLVEDDFQATSGSDDLVSIRQGRPKGQPSEGIETSRSTVPVAPGLDLTEFDRFEPDGWIRGDVLVANLDESGLRPEYLSSGAASAPAPLTDHAARVGAVAGVNGDFFDIHVTDAPLGVGMGGGELLHAPGAGHNDVAAIGGQQRLGRLLQVFLQAKVTRANGSTTAISELNAPVVPPNGIALYTPFWGSAPRGKAVDGARKVTEIEVAGGVVTAVRNTPAEGPVPGGAVRLLGRDSGADALASLVVGERIGVEYGPRAAGELPRVAIGGNKVLLRDGVVQEADDSELHPRTAAGFSADGTKMWLVTIDGRQADSRGMSERELAEQLSSLGADDAINLDGGGSSTMLARERGDSAAGVRNSPSDGMLRPVPNGVGFSVAPGSGRLGGFRVEPAVRVPHAERVLSGLTRTISAHGHDETGAPVAHIPQWTVSPPSRGRVRQEQGRTVFTAHEPGQAEVIARSGAVIGQTALSVLGAPTRVETDAGRLALAGDGARGRFRVLGYDQAGFGTWVEPSDVRLEYDPNLVRVTPNRDGFVVTALKPHVSAVITARVAGLATHLGVTVGSVPRQLSSMDGVEGWRSSAQPGTVRASLATAEGRSGSPGLALDYSLTGSTATRAAYVNADPPLPLPAGTQKVGAWVQGDGRGGWLRFSLRDSAGVSTTVDLARNVNWTGWRYVEAPIPPGLTGFPQLQRLYVVEPYGARQYEGRLVFDDLTASVAPEIHVPEQPEPRDETVVQDGLLHPGSGNRVAVVSDAQFTADDPDGPLVHKARRALREALAARPDMVVINGDFVDRGTAADFDLARQVIDSELGDRVRWHYVPGNHETYGPGDLSVFSAEFGPTHRVVDSRGTRFVFLDSSLGSLRAGGFDQVRMLRQALREGASDPGVRSVAVFLHHPADDPGPGEVSELSDPKEAALLTDWLADFKRASGKSAVSVSAHVGEFHASTVDGVPHLVNGNAGKAPAVGPGNGGFSGTSLLRIAPEDRAAPMRWETRPYVDELVLRVPGSLRVGARASVDAQVVQDGRSVPVAYPVSADWWGSLNVRIGPGGADRRHDAEFDPATGMLTAWKPGVVDLGVTVNGVPRIARFTVTR
jgi:hypothetical protein